MGRGIEYVVRTNKGKTGIGIEFRVCGVGVYDDFTKAEKEWLAKNRVSFMKRMYGVVEGKWVMTQESFCWKGFKTVEERDKFAALLEKRITKTEAKAKKAKAKKAEPKKAEPKKAEPKKAEKPAKPLAKMTKAELIALLEAAIG